MAFEVRFCCFWDGKEICQTAGVELEKLRAGRNILQSNEILQVSANDVMVVTCNNKAAKIVLDFYDKKGEKNYSYEFGGVSELEVEKLHSILAVSYEGKYWAFRETGEKLGQYDIIHLSSKKIRVLGRQGDKTVVLAE